MIKHAHRQAIPWEVVYCATFTRPTQTGMCLKEHPKVFFNSLLGERMQAQAVKFSVIQCQHKLVRV